MRFIVTLSHKASVQARALILRRPGDTPQDVADRLRDRLLEDGHAMFAARTMQVMTKATLVRFAEIAHRVAMEQAESGKSRCVTVYTNGTEEVHQAEGQIALLIGADNVSGTIEVLDDERLKRDSFGAQAERILGRPARPEDITLDDVSDDDMFRD